MLFARAEALHAHGHTHEACKLAKQLAEDMLTNPPDLSLEQPQPMGKGQSQFFLSLFPQKRHPCHDNIKLYTCFYWGGRDLQNNIYQHDQLNNFLNNFLPTLITPHHVFVFHPELNGLSTVVVLFYAGKKKKVQNSISSYASSTLAKAAFLCSVLLEEPECHHLAFRVGLFGLEMPRPPASSKALEVCIVC